MLNCYHGSFRTIEHTVQCHFFKHSSMLACIEQVVWYDGMKKVVIPCQEWLMLLPDNEQRIGRAMLVTQLLWWPMHCYALPLLLCCMHHLQSNNWTGLSGKKPWVSGRFLHFSVTHSLKDSRVDDLYYFTAFCLFV